MVRPPSYSRLARLHLLVLVGLMAVASTSYGLEDGFEPESGPPSQTGAELAVSAGYGTAAGRLTRGLTLRDRMAGAVPLGIELGWRFEPRWFVGGLLDYAPGFVPATRRNGCPDCTVTWLHLGLTIQRQIWSHANRNVWVALGAGLHWFDAEVESLAKRSRVSEGPEYLNVRFGSEWRSAQGFGIGPYLATSVGSITKRTEVCDEKALCPDQDIPRKVEDPGLHLWVHSGIRVVFLP